jgi:hypothetical protein
MPFIQWAGRFPFPTNENEIELYERGNKKLGFKPSYFNTIEDLFVLLEKEMNITSTKRSL